MSRRGGGFKRVAAFFNSWWVPLAVVFLAVVPSVYAAWSYRAEASAGEVREAGQAFRLREPVREAAEGKGTGSLDFELARSNAVSERIQLTLQLTIACGLRLSSERAVGRIPADAAELYNGMRRAGLAPRHLSAPQPGSRPDAVLLAYDGGQYLVRYVPERFLVEVVSVGPVGGDADPPMLMRAPGGGGRPDLPDYYRRLSGQPDDAVSGPRSPVTSSAPVPFSDAVSLVAAGWRSSELPFDVLNKVGLTR